MERLYRIYQNMIGRCTRKYNTSYNLYGARGISVCDEWMVKGGKGFRAFKEWALSNGYKDNLTLDRIDNNGNYEPDNCRWITISEQNRNKRTNIYIGEDVLKDYAKKHNINSRTVNYRYKKGKNLIKPTRHRIVVVDGEKYSPSEFANKYGFNLNSLQTAFSRGKAKDYILRSAYKTKLDIDKITQLEVTIEERG